MPDPDQSYLHALFCDPAIDVASPARTLPQAIPSGGVNLNAVLYTAAGPGPHPTVLLLHGLPGNEQNIDLAQTMRRAGWNVLTIHYRGSWGGPGAFSFTHCLEDAAAALDWMRNGAAHQALKLDPRRIVVVGHSMGGFIAVHLLAGLPEMLGAVMLSAVDLGRYFGSGDWGRSAARVDENVGFGAGLHILSDTSPEVLADEARTNANRWRLTDYAPSLAGRQLLMVTSDDGFARGSDALADAIPAAERILLLRYHFATDHSYSECRIGLQKAVLGWLATVSANIA